MRRAIALITALILIAPSSAIAADAVLGVRVDEATKMPDVTLSVTLPAEILGGTSAEPTFRVLENGIDTEVTGVQSATEAARAPVDVVLVLDTSGSMKGAPLGDAMRAARAFVGAMGPEDRTAVVTFAFEPKVRSGYLARYARFVTSADRGAVLE